MFPASSHPRSFSTPALGGPFRRTISRHCDPITAAAGREVLRLGLRIGEVQGISEAPIVVAQKANATPLSHFRSRTSGNDRSAPSGSGNKRSKTTSNFRETRSEACKQSPEQQLADSLAACSARKDSGSSRGSGESPTAPQEPQESLVIRVPALFPFPRSVMGGSVAKARSLSGNFPTFLLHSPVRTLARSQAPTPGLLSG